MVFSSQVLICVLCFVFPVSLALPSPSYCKPRPGDAHWPSISSWKALNVSISGRLLEPVPPGAVCHPSWPQFDNATCATVVKSWNNTQFHGLNPESVDYNDVACLPDPSMPCSTKGYPSYVVEATNAKDVQEAVKFAKETGVRLIVKGTGHDFPGRSSGADSLSIWTHHIRGLKIVQTLDSQSPTKPVALIKIHAGERMGRVYEFAAKHNLTIIGGADPHVGIGGFILGGGHGPLTAKYGMAADQVVEMEIVTADGELRTVNEHRDSDIFWAMRGSGGSTYGVIISVTMKAYPPTSFANYLFAYNTTSDSESFWSMAAYFHSQLPALSQAGLMGYYFLYPLQSGVTNASIQGQVVGQFLGPGLSAAKATELIKPMEDTMSKANWGDPVYPGGIATEEPDFCTYWSETSLPEAAGFAGRLGSRLLGESALTSDVGKLKAALKKSTPPPWPLLGHVTAGPGTHNPPNGISGGSNAVGPAWREAYTLLITPREWPALNASAEKSITTQLRNVWNAALTEIAPNTGSYVNECDPTMPDWKTSLYGANYPRLLDIKQRWDPTGVFWCKHCVGSDLWEQVGPYGIENGVGQNPVKLCVR